MRDKRWSRMADKERRMIGKNLRKILLPAMAAVFLAGSAGAGTARAGEQSTEVWRLIETDKTDCSIALTMTYSIPETGETGVKMQDGEVSIYRVATVKVDNGFLFDTSGGQFAENAALSGLESMNSAALNENNARLAETLADNITVTPLATGTVSNGEVSFQNLTPGLYLLIQNRESSEGYSFSPFLMSIPDAAGSYNITAAPKPGILGAPSGERESETETEKQTEPPKTPTPPKKPEEPTPPGRRLPQTGQLWWPVPLGATAGLLLIVYGILRRRSTGRR